MGNTWVLDTDTKGTGAQMVPLEKVLSEEPAPRARRVAAAQREPGQAEASDPRRPPRFKVVEVVSGRVLIEGATTRETVALLEGVRSVVDVTIHVWDPEAAEWRQLTHGAKKRVWGLRARRSSASSASRSAA